MANALKTFIPGEKITAEDANNNNRYLENLNSSSAADLRKYLEGEISKLKAEMSGSVIKVGTVIILPCEKRIDGYLKCDGSSLLRSDYEDLYNEIGTVYGAADDYHFNVPDFQGLFLRGLGGNSATLGTKQECALPNITGSINKFLILNSGPATGAIQSVMYNQYDLGFGGRGSNYYFTINFNASYSNAIYKNVQEARPVNMAVNFWIKY